MSGSTSNSLAASAARIEVHLRRLGSSSDSKQISELKVQIGAIHKASQRIIIDKEKESKGEAPTKPDWGERDVESLQKLRNTVDIIVERCYEATLRPLREAVPQTPRKHSSSSHEISSDVKEMERHNEVCLALQLQAQTLYMLHNAIDFVFDSKKYPENAANLERSLQPQVAQLRRNLNDIPGDYMKRFLGDLQPLLEAVDAVSSSMDQGAAHLSNRPSRENQHFLVDRSTSAEYVGRQKELAEIHEAFAASYQDEQRRFVIHGEPGSGKSELALKFALDGKSNYWGIFWVDASSFKAAYESFRKIAQLSGSEPNGFSGAKTWLSNLGKDYEWLMIIDNIDLDERWIGDMFPAGRRGSVILTTRNPEHIEYGNTGHVSLQGMREDEANALLLKSARITEKLTEELEKDANEICSYLRCLPLALVQAGRAILRGLCKLTGYISFVDETIFLVRERWERRRHGYQKGKTEIPLDDLLDKRGKAIFGSYEMLYLNLENAATGKSHVNNEEAVDIEACQDALQILQVFSYLHFQNIRLDMFIRAAINPMREEEEKAALEKQEDKVIKESRVQLPRQSLRTLLQGAIVNAAGLSETPPVLPEAMKNTFNDNAHKFERQVSGRLRAALRELEERGLISTFNGDGKDGHPDVGGDERYHMHPMVHLWVRERPRMVAAEDGLFCQLAKTVLARAVRLVGKDGPNEQAMRRDLRPHINHVKEQELKIRQRTQENRGKRRSLWHYTMFWLRPTIPDYGKLQAIEDARFSRVYLESGDFSGAVTLLQDVTNFTLTHLGPDHPKTHLAQLGLAKALSLETKHNDAMTIQRKVFDSRKQTLGKEHPKTLEIMRELGASVLGRTLLQDALDYTEEARDGLQRLYGKEHIQTLKCELQLGSVHYFFLDLEKSLEHNRRAYEGAKKIEASFSQEELLTFQEEYAMALLRTGKDLELAERLERDVLEQRTKLFREAHPYTLYAKGNHGKALSALGRYEEAEKKMKGALKLAEDTLGKEHLGVMAGKLWLSQVYMDKRDFQEAERRLREIVSRSHYQKASGSKDGEHRDRIMVVWTLIKCLEHQDKLDEALKLCKELQGSLPEVGDNRRGAKHKLFKEISEKADELTTRIEELGRSVRVGATRQEKAVSGPPTWEAQTQDVILQ